MGEIEDVFSKSLEVVSKFNMLLVSCMHVLGLANIFAYDHIYSRVVSHIV
jgi:hypothetical protein